MEYFIIVLIGLLIHESGHYIAAVSCGVSVRKFCVFFDPGFHLFSTGKVGGANNFVVISF